MHFAEWRAQRFGRTRGGLLLASCIAALACTSPTIDGAAPPYDPTALTGGIVYHWSPGHAIAIYIVPDAGGLLESVARSAATRWTGALAYREQTVRIVARADQADIVLRDRAAALPVDTTGCGVRWTESAASTLFCALGDTARTLPQLTGPAGHTKVVITVDVAAVADASELLTVIVHEIGHALGIGGHSGNPADVMFAAPSVATPSSADERTLRYVLHRRPDLRL